MNESPNLDRLGASRFGIRSGSLGEVSTQIAVRLPDRMVEFLDAAIADGRAASRAALITSAVEREMRRLLAEADATVLTEQGCADDLDDLVGWTAQQLDAHH